MENFKIKVKSKEVNRFYPYVRYKELENVLDNIFYSLNEKEQKKVKIVIKSVDKY